ncbi:MAG: hypothetical protein Q8P18_18210 [Pseudomonadota bacterium]|nr:hypothetical protein [Pseudomonadota bacterium]
MGLDGGREGAAEEGLVPAEALVEDDDAGGLERGVSRRVYTGGGQERESADSGRAEETRHR